MTGLLVQSFTSIETICTAGDSAMTYAMKLPTFAEKLGTVAGMLRSWPLESKQIKIGYF